MQTRAMQCTHVHTCAYAQTHNAHVGGACSCGSHRSSCDDARHRHSCVPFGHSVPGTPSRLLPACPLSPQLGGVQDLSWPGGPRSPPGGFRLAGDREDSLSSRVSVLWVGEGLKSFLSHVADTGPLNQGRASDSLLRLRRRRRSVGAQLVFGDHGTWNDSVRLRRTCLNTRTPNAPEPGVQPWFSLQASPTVGRSPLLEWRGARWTDAGARAVVALGPHLPGAGRSPSCARSPAEGAASWHGQRGLRPQELAGPTPRQRLRTPRLTEPHARSPSMGECPSPGIPGTSRGAGGGEGVCSSEAEPGTVSGSHRTGRHQRRPT